MFKFIIVQVIMLKIIRDLVHGYIEINENEEGIINTFNFQRLKDISQLTAQHLFPSATHTRFEHSLGVMALTKKAFKSLKRKLQVQVGHSHSKN